MGCMDWRFHALCLDEDPELFFPVGTAPPALEQVDRAKAICRRCPVQAQCLEWSLVTCQDAGVWGGLDEEERREIRRARRRARGLRPVEPTLSPAELSPV